MILFSERLHDFSQKQYILQIILEILSDKKNVGLVAVIFFAMVFVMARYWHNNTKYVLPTN